MAAEPYPPEGVGIKLAGAPKHLEELRGEIDTFFEPPPFRYVLRRDGLTYVLREYLTRWLPEVLPVIIGDCCRTCVSPCVSRSTR